ncbi:MAG: methylmalonyl-CoA epimerase [Pseudomonadota bacterium]
MRLSHIAIATPNIQKAIEPYRLLFSIPDHKPEALPEHGVRVLFFTLGQIAIELIEPLGEDSPIDGFLRKHPRGGMHHICLATSDLVRTCAVLREKNYRLIGEPRPGFHGNLVVFLHPHDWGGVLFELEQDNQAIHALATDSSDTP